MDVDDIYKQLRILKHTQLQIELTSQMNQFTFPNRYFYAIL